MNTSLLVDDEPEKVKKSSKPKKSKVNDPLQEITKSLEGLVKESSSFVRIKDDQFTRDNAKRLALRVVYGIKLLNEEGK